MKTSDLTGPALDLAVSRASNPEGRDGWGWFERDAEGFLFDPLNECRYSPSTDWAQGGPIIEREGITVVCAEGDYSSELRGYETYWVADIGKQCANSVYGPQGDNWGTCFQIDDGCTSGATPLIAAMRCYVTSKLGEFVDIPEELV